MESPGPAGKWPHVMPRLFESGTFQPAFIADNRSNKAHDEAVAASAVAVKKGSFFQHSRAYMMASIGFMGIFLFGYGA